MGDESFAVCDKCGNKATNMVRDLLILPLTQDKKWMEYAPYGRLEWGCENHNVFYSRFSDFYFAKIELDGSLKFIKTNLYCGYPYKDLSKEQVVYLLDKLNELGYIK